MLNLHIFSAIIGLVVNVIVQICSFRYVRKLDLLISIFFGFIVGICTLLFVEWWYFTKIILPLSERIFSIFVNIITYFALGYGYFHFVNLGETARRIRILRELIDSENGLSINEIFQRYNARDIIEVRINRLIKNGQIICKNNRYYIGKPFVLWMAKIITTLKFIILGRRGEFGETTKYKHSN